MEKIIACRNCMHYKQVKGKHGLSLGHSCTKKQQFPNCDFLHFFYTWSNNMQSDAASLVNAGEIIPGLLKEVER
jgi:hypothetical protein